MSATCTNHHPHSNTITHNPCYLPVKNQVVSMMIWSLSRTVLEALFAVIAGVTSQNNGRQALPLLVRPRFQPGDQTGFGALQVFS